MSYSKTKTNIHKHNTQRHCLFFPRIKGFTNRKETSLTQNNLQEFNDNNNYYNEPLNVNNNSNNTYNNQPMPFNYQRNDNNINYFEKSNGLTNYDKEEYIENNTQTIKTNQRQPSQYNEKGGLSHYNKYYLHLTPTQYNHKKTDNDNDNDNNNDNAMIDDSYYDNNNSNNYNSTHHPSNNHLNYTYNDNANQNNKYFNNNNNINNNMGGNLNVMQPPKYFQSQYQQPTLRRTNIQTKPQQSFANSQVFRSRDSGGGNAGYYPYKQTEIRRTNYSNYNYNNQNHMNYINQIQNNSNQFNSYNRLFVCVCVFFCMWHTHLE